MARLQSLLSRSTKFGAFSRLLLALYMLVYMTGASALAQTSDTMGAVSTAGDQSIEMQRSAGWNDPVESESTEASTSQKGGSLTSAFESESSATATPGDDGSVIEVDNDATAEKTETSLAPVPGSTETAGDKVSAATTESPTASESVARESAKTSDSSTSVASSDSVDAAEKTEVSEEQPGDAKPIAASKVGIGGFASEDESDELSFLQEGYVVENEGEVDVIVIDNDEEVEVEQTIAYEELPTDDGKTYIKAGAQFPIVMASQISSKTAKKGDTIQGRLKYDLEIGERLVAKRGDMVRGHISYRMPARSVMHSLVSPHRWYRNSGVIGLEFDEIVSYNGEHVALNAKPARKSRIVKNKAEGRLLGVNHNGEITGPWGQQLRYKAIRIGLNAALAPAGVFSFGAMPVALGVMGAVNPSFAFMKPVGTNVPHRRIKGFCWGFLSGIPGSWIIEDTVTKGQECIIKPGDEFLVELNQKFTGEAVTSAQLMPGSDANVQGEVVGSKDNKVKGKLKKMLKKGGK